MHTTEKETYYAILIAMLTLAIIILCFIASVIRQHRRYRRLYQEKIKAEITTLENERQRLSGDLHDELGPALAGVKLKLSGISNLSAIDNEAVNSVLLHIDKMVAQIRNISYGLMPPALETKGAFFAIETYIKYINNSSGLSVDFKYNNIQLQLQQEVHIYRILLEIIHNTIKHAAASQLHIELNLYRNGLLITTADNGKGFNYKKSLKAGNGLGLYNLQSRVDILNGLLKLESTPGNGTSYTIEIPLTNN